MSGTKWQATFHAAIMMSPALIHKTFLHIFSLTCVACSDPALLAGKRVPKGTFAKYGPEETAELFSRWLDWHFGDVWSEGCLWFSQLHLLSKFPLWFGCPGYLGYKTRWIDFIAYLRSEGHKVTPQICCSAILEKPWPFDSETPA